MIFLCFYLEEEVMEEKISYHEQDVIVKDRKKRKLGKHLSHHHRFSLFMLFNNLFHY